MITFTGEHLDRRKFSLWTSAAEVPPDDTFHGSFTGEHLDRRKFSLWTSVAEVPPENDNFHRRAFRQAEILAVDVRRRSSARE